MSREVNDTIDDLLKSLRWRVEELEAALREIRNHLHCHTGCPEPDPAHLSAHLSGTVDGHRCCAEIARKALEK